MFLENSFGYDLLPGSREVGPGGGANLDHLPLSNISRVLSRPTGIEGFRIYARNYIVKYTKMDIGPRDI